MQKLNNRSFAKYELMSDAKVAQEIISEKNLNFGIHLIDKIAGLQKPLIIADIKKIFRSHGATESEFTSVKQRLEAMGIVKMLPDNTNLEFTERGNNIFNHHIPKVKRS